MKIINFAIQWKKRKQNQIRKPDIIVFIDGVESPKQDAKNVHNCLSPKKKDDEGKFIDDVSMR